jgi:hypothetical protein
VLARPLLTVSKARLIATCAANGLPYVTDRTNIDIKHHTNAVRAVRLFPVIWLAFWGTYSSGRWLWVVESTVLE